MMIQDKFISLEGKVAIITGAGQGIGLAIAQLYAKYGAAVAMVDVSDKCAEEAGKIRELGAEAQAFKCDVTSEDDVKKTVEAVMQAFGHIDILVNNAGIIVRKTVLDTTVEEWDRCMDIGLKGTFLFSKHVVPIMIKEGGGVIVNTASGAALKGVPDAAPYNAVKGGVAALTRGMAVDFGKYNIRVNCVCSSPSACRPARSRPATRRRPRSRPRSTRSSPPAATIARFSASARRSRSPTPSSSLPAT